MATTAQVDDLSVSAEPISSLHEHGRIPIAFQVDRVIGISSNGQVGPDRALDKPYVKDYDVCDGAPRAWATRFDVSRWDLIVARVAGCRVGGAVIAFDTPDLTMLEGRPDLAVLWDIRVAPAYRGRGIGIALFSAVEVWAIARGCRELHVETQNINVPACRFYARRGCVLKRIDRHAYPQFPDEIQMLWSKSLVRTRAIPPPLRMLRQSAGPSRRG